jgi:hypothetical protein
MRRFLSQSGQIGPRSKLQPRATNFSAAMRLCFGLPTVSRDAEIESFR